MAQNMSMKVQPFSRESIVSFKDPRQLWTENWFALVLEVVSAVIVFQVFRNAKKNNPKTAYLLLSAVFAEICFEILPIIPRPGYQLWWYHQGLVNFLKQRVPSYVISIYALVHYMGDGLTSRSNLPALTRSVLTAMCSTLIMFPFLWFAPRLLLVVFHLDDPVFKERLFGVPYIEVLVVFLLFFHTSHLFHQNYFDIDAQERNTYSYVKCAIQTGMVSATYSIVEQYLLYILFNLILRTHTGICLVAALLILSFLAKDELKEMQMSSYSIQGIISPLMRKELWIAVAAMLFTLTLPLWLNPYSLKSSSDRLELGPCHITHEVSNTSPLEIVRRRYICPDDATRLNFDFHCLTNKEIAQGVTNKVKNYAVCGKNFENPFEIVKCLSIYSACCVTLFYVVLLFSFTFKVQEKKILEPAKKVE